MCHLFKMRKVETQVVGINIRTLLLYMSAKNLAKSIMKQMGSSMIICCFIPLFLIHTSYKTFSGI